MCLSDSDLLLAYDTFRSELIEGGLLIPLGVAGVYGRSGVFEGIVDKLESFISREGAFQNPEVMRFPPILSRETYIATDHIENMPDLMGSVHSFDGGDRDQRKLIERVHAGEQDWASDLCATEVMLAPAACYPLYPTATGALPEQGRVVDLETCVFRHEPSPDPARMQSFRQREFVRLGTAEQALEHRNSWLKRAETMLLSLGLDVQVASANDPFFGRSGKFLKASQLELELKFEILAPICSSEKLTAISSCNYHLDHFGQSFDIKSADGQPAHTACIGFGMERITLALLKAHGLDPQKWPVETKTILRIE